VLTNLALVTAATDGDPDALGHTLAIAERTLGDALVAPDPDVGRAAGDALLSVLTAQALLSGVVPPTAARSVWPLPALLELLPVLARGVSHLDVPEHRSRDRHDAVAQIVLAYAVLSEAVR
jgi:hypothetical protein